MQLVQFISDLIQKGKVTLIEEIVPFEAHDLEQTGLFLSSFYQYDAQEMPLSPPEYDSFAAVWAANYICRAIQLILVRKHGEEVIANELKPFSKAITPEAAYSADLCLRYLPQLLNLAKGISPNDPLVLNMLQTAQDWPFSSVGIEVEAAPLPPHPSLEIAYTDRIIAANDVNRSKTFVQNLQIQTALGAHAEKLWPNFVPFEKIENESI